VREKGSRSLLSNSPSPASRERVLRAAGLVRVSTLRPR
jgi:hypothetical protein